MPQRLLLTTSMLCLGLVVTAHAKDLDPLLSSGLGQPELRAIAPEHHGTLAALTDGDSQTAAAFLTEPGVPVDVVFAFPGEGVAPERLILTHTNGSSAARPAGFDLLYSNSSPTSGFVSVRNGPLDQLKPEESITLPLGGALWVMLRLYPGSETDGVSLADVALLGAEGPPQTTYAFGESPAQALEVINALSALDGASFSLTPAEREVFARASDGEIGQQDFEEIALIASGVRSPADRTAFVNEINQLEVRLRAEIDVGAEPLELGRTLLTWLHAHVLTAGYQEKQTNLSTILEDARFNCVSSAVIYNILGQRLGLDLRAIEVPDHAFSILYDGADHVDVETTTPHGFNPRRDRIAEFELLTGFEYIPQSNKSKRREIGRAGLAALIYYNHGVNALRAGRYQEALLANFRAMSLDPEFDSAATNALASMGRWSRDLSDQKDWARAVEVVAMARTLAPQDRGIANTQMVIWRDWALETAANGDYSAALGLLERGSQSNPDADFAPLKTALFVRPAEELIDVGDWNGAMEIAAEGRRSLQGEGQEDLEKWHQGLFLRRSNLELKAANFEAAAYVLGLGLEAYPASRSVLRNVRYTAQEWARSAKDVESGLAALQTMHDRFGAQAELDDVATSFVIRSLRKRSTAGAPLADVQALAARAQPVLAAVGSDVNATAEVFRIFGNAAIEAKSWPEAAEMYGAALLQFPDDRGIRQNSRFVAQEWQRAALDQGGNAALQDVVTQLRVLFPSFASQQGFGEQELRNRVIKLTNAGEFADAFDVLEGAQLLFAASTYDELRGYLVERQAATAIDTKSWATAAELYSEGRKLLGADKFSRNLAYVAQEWTRAAWASDGAQGVSEVMARLASLFPADAKVAEVGFETLERIVADLATSADLRPAQEQIVVARRFLSSDQVDALTETLYRRRGDVFLDVRDWAGALKSYATGLALVPGSRDLARNVPYVVQEWSAQALAEGGADGFLDALAAMTEEMDVKNTQQRVISSVVSRHVAGLVDDDRPRDAIDLVDQIATVVEDKVAHKAKTSAYERWARQYFETDWAKAIEIYEAGLRDLGDSSLLSNNLKYARSKLP